jgi:mannose-6-phosphate isomerase-like protein (cupin superfamily)
MTENPTAAKNARAAPPSESFVVEAGGNRLPEPLNVVGDSIRVKISSRDTSGAFTVLEGITQPQEGPPLHRHRAQDEWFYVVEGQYLFEIDGRQVRAETGATVFAAKGSRHTFQNIGNVPGRMIMTVVPGGIDTFFTELSAAVPAGAVPDPAKLRPVFEKYGLELLGPPIAAG